MYADSLHDIDLQRILNRCGAQHRVAEQFFRWRAWVEFERIKGLQLLRDIVRLRVKIWQAVLRESGDRFGGNRTGVGPDGCDRR